jgi:hypothetical protein
LGQVWANEAAQFSVAAAAISSIAAMRGVVVMLSSD